MDTKNIIAAISLSIAIIVLWSLFFPPPSQEKLSKSENESENVLNSTDTPSIDPKTSDEILSRDNALKISERIYFENENIKGSISLNGATIDDLIFKKYKKKIDTEEKVILLNPKNTSLGYYVETGWVTNSKNIDLPDNQSIWKVDGNSELSPNKNVKIFWQNKQGLTFEKNISIDSQYLFTINQTVKNNSNSIYNFYPYGQIVREKIPEIVDFFILHEGPIGVFDNQLVEKDYKDIVDKKFSRNVNEGFLGITDKYWITSLIPEKNKKFRADFEYKKKFKTNFIEINPIEIQPKSQISNEIKVIIAAKEVNVIDGYNESLNLSKFDLVIDWGWFYWTNLVRSSNLKDYGSFTKDFSTQMLFGANEVELGKQWANNELITNLNETYEPFGTLRRGEHITILIKQTNKKIPGEFLGRLVLGVEDGAVKVFGATIY